MTNDRALDDELADDELGTTADVRRWRLPTQAFAFSKISGVYVWALLLVIFAFWVPHTFYTSITLRDIAGAQALTAILTIGVLLPLAAGAFDLSVGGTLGVSSILTAYLIFHGMNHWEAAGIALLAGAGIGFVNAVLVVVCGIDPLIETLGMSSVLTAGVMAISNNQQIIGLPDSFQRLGTMQPFGVPVTVVYLGVIAVFMWYVLEHTPYGRQLYAIGSNREAARLAGVRTREYLFSTLVISAVIAAFVGVIVTAKVGAGSPDIGPPYLLPAYAAAFLGATQIKPGRFNVVGALVAIYLLATGVKGLQLGGAPFWVTPLFNGLALIVAVGLSRFQGQVRLRRAGRAQRGGNQ